MSWQEFNTMTPGESVALARALTDLLKQEDELKAKLAGARLG